MTPEEEMKIRQQAEQQALKDFMQSLITSYVMSRGEIAVLKAKAEARDE